MPRLSTMDTMGRKRSRDTREEGPEGASKRKRFENLHLAFAMDRGVVEGRAIRWGPLLKDMWGASFSLPLASMGAAISA